MHPPFFTRRPVLTDAAGASNEGRDSVVSQRITPLLLFPRFDGFLARGRAPRPARRANGAFTSSNRDGCRATALGALHVVAHNRAQHGTSQVLPAPACLGARRPAGRGGGGARACASAAQA